MRHEMLPICLFAAIFACNLWNITTSQHVESSSPFQPIDAEVEDLKATADFRTVRLVWRMRSSSVSDSGVSGFFVRYCELSSWGKGDRCVTQFVNGSESASTVDSDTGNDVQQKPARLEYSTAVHGLRLATNYSFEIQPFLNGWQTPAYRGRSAATALAAAAAAEAAIPSTLAEITVATKGFSVRPRSCLNDRSEIDVETGPFFGGRISVEGSTDERCSLTGDATNPTNIYTFVIKHSVCGVKQRGDSIESIIIITESRSIITHTARRFMVACNLLPETYTIKTSLHIPDLLAAGRKKEAGAALPDNSIEDAPPTGYDFNAVPKFLDSQITNSLQSAEQAAHLFEDNRKEATISHLVLMAILLIAAAVGVLGAAWWLIGSSRRLSGLEGLDGVNSFAEMLVEKETADEASSTCGGCHDDSNDGKLVFVASSTRKSAIASCGRDSPVSLSGGGCSGLGLGLFPLHKPERATFVLNPAMNVALKSIGDSNC